MKKMNNKGFSLVELIVVVLIMAIIAVALAPQVMKWVENSRLSSDKDTYEQFISNLQIALTDKELGSTITATSFLIKSDGVYAGTAGSEAQVTGATATSGDIKHCLDKVAADWYKAKSKSSSNPDSNPMKITVSADKMITRAKEPATNADLS